MVTCVVVSGRFIVLDPQLSAVIACPRTYGVTQKLSVIIDKVGKIRETCGVYDIYKRSFDFPKKKMPLATAGAGDFKTFPRVFLFCITI